MKVIDGINYPFTDAHAFFARAVQYPALRQKVERYARLALQSYHLYTDLPDETNTVPGTFAATALAFCGLEYMPLVSKYASAVDGDHSYIHAALPNILLKHYGPAPEVYSAVSSLCAAVTQDYEVKLPKKMLAKGDAAAALADYTRRLDMPERAQFEYLYFTMQTMVGPDEKRNLKALASYAAAAETPQDKGAIIDLHNL